MVTTYVNQFLSYYRLVVEVLACRQLGCNEDCELTGREQIKEEFCV